DRHGDPRRRRRPHRRARRRRPRAGHRAPGLPRADARRLIRSRPVMREYAVVLLTAALVTFLATPVVRMVAIRLCMMAAPRERDVHVIPTPRGGGVAMYLGVAAAILVATRLPALQRTFDDSQTAAVL